MNTLTINKILIRLFLGSALSVALNPVIAGQVAQTPLSAATGGTKPNIMLMIDNSASMGVQNVITTSSTPITPSSLPEEYTYNCSNPVTGGTQGSPVDVIMRISGSSAPGTVQFCTGTGSDPCSPASKVVNFGSSSSCFDNSKYYNVKNTSGSVVYSATKGLNLNWYFTVGFFSPGNFSAVTPSKTTRMIITKNAARTLVDTLTPTTGSSPTVRLGLSTFDFTDPWNNTIKNQNSGGELLVAMGDLNATLATTIKDKIGTATLNSSGTTETDTGSIRPTAYTPLAETLADIGRYFATGETGNLTLPNNPASLKTGTVDQIFSYPATSTSAAVDGLKNSTGSAITAPVQNYCQKNYVILMTDGLPNQDRQISPYLRNYSGECIANTSPVPSGTTCISDTIPEADPDSISSYTNGDFCGYTTQANGSKTKDSNFFTCTNDMAGTSGTCKTDKYNIACQNGTKKNRIYERLGSDYLDDVAHALYDIDLRPTWSPAKPTGYKTNIKTYAIGIADTKLQTNSILEDATKNGHGKFRFAGDYQGITDALNEMLADIRKGEASFSAIVANSTQLGTDSAIFQAKYDTADWSGDFLAWALDSTTGDIITPYDWNGGEIKDSTPRITPYNKVDSTGSIDTATTPAQFVLTRNIFTYNTANKGIAFKNTTTIDICNKLSAAQKDTNTGLGITSCASSDQGVWRLNWLRGDISHEEISHTHQDTYNATSTPKDPRASLFSAETKIFRNRARFYGAGVAGHDEGDIRQDPWLLGDIVNSDAVYVSNEDYGYETLSGMSSGEKSAYTDFLASKSDWRKMVYIGANDGFLHGFDAKIDLNDSYADEGKEILAYLPDAVYSNLQNLSSTSYTHHYFVDGSPKVGDVYFSNDWHTVLVGTTGAGGKGIFALDVTDVSNATTSDGKSNAFSNTDVLWEISDRIPPSNNTTNNTTGNMSSYDFVNNIGYTFAQPSIGKMNDGSWVAVVANGYDSANKNAVLYIINIADGSILAAFNTDPSNTTAAANGLSTPFIADTNNDGTIDAIYAGDLLGNMWKFDVSNSNKNNWTIAYGTSTAPKPLFVACSKTDATDATVCENNRQPITAKPQVGKVGSSQTGGVMVYFGTGQYFETTDNTNTGTLNQSFYGVWDITNTSSTEKCANPPFDRSCLQEQSILSEATVPNTSFVARTSTNNDVNYSAKKGWFIDFINVNSTTTPKANDGERVISSALLRGNRVIFVTFIPIPAETGNTDPCANSTSASWLFELNALTGNRLPTSVLDINGSGTIDNSDMVNETAGSSNKVPASSIKNPSGGTKTPAVLNVPGADEVKFTGSSSGSTPSKIAEKADASSDTDAARQSWRQL